MVLEIVQLSVLVYLIFLVHKTKKEVHRMHCFMYDYTDELSKILHRYIGFMNLLQPKDMSDHNIRLWNKLHTESKNSVDYLQHKNKYDPEDMQFHPRDEKNDAKKTKEDNSKEEEW
ncbi:MAG: hypothetical protein ABSH12_04345 [Endomicrobiales bacterium]|jgi:gas vesicle protein